MKNRLRTSCAPAVRRGDFKNLKLGGCSTAYNIVIGNCKIMLFEQYNGYQIIANPMKTNSGKFSVSVIISKNVNNNKYSKTFYADDNIHYILEIEAGKECINLGKNLINKNLVGF